MPKKPAKPNAFMMYVMKRKAEMEQDGHKFPNGVPDAVAQIGHEWETLSKEERLPYEEKAKAKKAKAQEDRMNEAFPSTSNKSEFGSGSMSGIPG